MKYLKKWSLYLEDFEAKDSDPSDIKMAKQKLNTLRLQIDEFNKKYKDIFHNCTTYKKSYKHIIYHGICSWSSWTLFSASLLALDF